MKPILARSFIRGMALGLAVLSFATVAKAHPYASCITNYSAGGTNFVSFYLNEGGGAVSVVTYPSGATNSLGTLPAGSASFALGSDTSYSIIVTKTGAGSPAKVSADGGLNWLTNGNVQIRDVAVNNCAQYGDAFGRVAMAVTGTTTTDTKAPAFRGSGIYALTPDLAKNALYGGSSALMAVPTVQSNTLTFTAIPTNNATFVMDGKTLTWTTNTPGANQVAIDPGGIANNATNLANALNAAIANHPGTLSVGVVSNVVFMMQFAQTTSGASYFTYGNPAAYGPFGPAWYYGNSGNNIQVGPIHMTVNSLDGTIWVSDSTFQGANVFEFGRNYEFTNQVFTETGDNQVTGEHGGIEGLDVRGSIAQGNLQLWTYDFDLSVPQYFNNTNLGTMGNGGVGNFGGPQVTQTGDQNEVYRYDIGSGNGTNASGFPVTNTPVWACTLGLNGANFGGQRGIVCIGPNTNYVYAGFFRANLSDGNLQVFRSDTGARVSTSLGGTAQSPTDWAATDPDGNKGILSARVSPDGRFLAWTFSDSYIGVVNLVDGIPDPSSLVYINNGKPATSSRGISWDAADNLYAPGNGATILREYSLGLTTTCITSNDISGTNGSFQFSLPNADVTATVANNASQYYGSPLVGNVNINIGTSSLANPLTVPFTIKGTGTNGVNYTVNYGTNNGVIIASNSATAGSITFPAGSQVGNINANISFTPTASPVIGPTLTAVVAISPGATYLLGSPGTASLNISNTGPQYFFINASPVAGTKTMNRGITNDYAEFWIGRWGDLNGPGNAANAVVPKTITLNNFTLLGTAQYGVDFTAGIQPVIIGSTPQDGSGSVAFNPGDSNIVVLIGNPVSHANVLVPPTNVTIIPYLTNSAGPGDGTTQMSAEGYTYTVNPAGPVTLTELDNAQGTRQEVVVWSDPLTNSVNPQATVTYAAGIMATNTVLPVVLSPYVYTNGGLANGNGSLLSAPSNYFDVQLGWPIANENAWETQDGVGFLGPAYSPPPSAVMVNNGWSNVLRMSFDKQQGASPTMGGVNYFPTTNQFYGNYAMRFDMYLSVWSGALGNNDALQYPKQFAAFGINHQGTNCDWRTNPSGGQANQNNVTNNDGIWFSIDAADLSLTPADFDSFASPALPNMGSSDIQSSTAVAQSEVFKTPPFALLDGSGGGTPHNQWVNVSVETRAGANGLQTVSMSVDDVAIFTGITLTNTAVTPPNNILGVPSGNWSNGVPMLGYLQPYNYQSDESAFVYYSNLRIVELSPTITAPPSSVLALEGSTVTLASSGSYSQSGLTNTWETGTTSPTTVVSDDAVTSVPFTYSGINYNGGTDTLTLSNVVNGNNYWAIWSDSAGVATSYVASVEVVVPPASTVANDGANATFTVSGSGPAPLTTFQWQTNGVNIANGTKYANATTATLTVKNVTADDGAVTYNCVVGNNVTNLVGLYVVTGTQTLTTPGASLAVVLPPTFSSSVSINGGNVNMSFTSPNGFDTTSSYKLLSSPVVTGPYTNDPSAVFATNGVGGFTVSAPQTTNSSMFYLLEHN